VVRGQAGVTDRTRVLRRTAVLVGVAAAAVVAIVVVVPRITASQPACAAD
jgi:hypothetical protein